MRVVVALGVVLLRRSTFIGLLCSVIRHVVIFKIPMTSLTMLQSTTLGNHQHIVTDSENVLQTSLHGGNILGIHRTELYPVGVSQNAENDRIRIWRTGRKIFNTLNN